MFRRASQRVMGQLKVPMSLHAVSHCGTTTWHDEPMCCVKPWVTTAHTPNMTMVVPLCDTAHTTNPSQLWNGTERQLYVCDVSHCGTPTYCHDTCCVTLWDNHQFLWAYMLCHNMGQPTVSISAVSHNGTTNYIKTIMGPRLRAPVRVPEALCNGRM